MFKYKFITLFVITTILWPSYCLCRSGVSIVNVMVTEPPPGVGMTAGYFDIRNTGSQPVSLIKVTSPDFGSIELHRSIVTEGIARMVRQDSVTVPPDTSLKFQPGDYHLMMFRPHKQLSTGDMVTLTFYFSDSTSLNVKAMIMKQGAGHDTHTHQHH